MSPEARESSFDELARGLASGSLTRGKALRLMGAALVGGALASIPGLAWAAPQPKFVGARCKDDSQCTLDCIEGFCSGYSSCKKCPPGCDCAVYPGSNGVRCRQTQGAHIVSSCGACDTAAGELCAPYAGSMFVCAQPCAKKP
jgi:hypothetical protein